MTKAESILETYAYNNKNWKDIDEMNDEIKKIDDLNKTIDGLNAEIEHMDAEIVRLKAENAAMRQILHSQVDARIERLAQSSKDSENYISFTDDFFSGKWSF